MPSEILKFYARVMIQVRGGKMLELRLSDESEELIIDIDNLILAVSSLVLLVLFYSN